MLGQGLTVLGVAEESLDDREVRGSPSDVAWAVPSQLFCRVTDESGGNVCCPVFRSSLRGALCLGSEESWRPEVRGKV